MTFKERLGELLDSVQIDDPRDRVELRFYCKWRIQAKCLLINSTPTDKWRMLNQHTHQIEGDLMPDIWQRGYLLQFSLPFSPSL